MNRSKHQGQMKAVTVAAALFVGVAMIGDAVWWGVSIYWANPDMTSQRLFLTFWPEYLGIWALSIAGLAVIKAGVWIEDHE